MVLHTVRALATHVLLYKAEIILSREEDTIAPVEHRMDGPLCFYDVLADYYVQVPDSGKPILDLIVKLWSQSFTCHIFTLLFHKWVGELASDVVFTFYCRYYFLFDDGII